MVFQAKAVESFVRYAHRIRSGGKGGGREGALGGIVHGEHVPIPAGFEDGEFSSSLGNKNLAVGGDRRRGMAAQGAAHASRLQDFPRGGTERGENSPVLDDVQDAVIKQRRRNDAGEALVVSPKLARMDGAAGGIEMHGEQACRAANVAGPRRPISSLGDDAVAVAHELAHGDVHRGLLAVRCIAGDVLILVRSEAAVVILVESGERPRKRTGRIGAVPEGVDGVVIEHWAGHHRRAQARLTEHPLSIGEPVSAVLAGAGGENHGRRAGRLVEQRGGPAFGFLARSFPEDLAIAAVEGGDVGAGDLVDLKDNRIARENRRCAEAHGVHEWAERHSPSNLAGRVIRDEAEILEEDVDVFAIGNGSDGRGIVEKIPFRLGGSDLHALPKQLTCFAIEALGEQLFLFKSGEKYAVGVEHRRGFSGPDRRSPEQVARLIELHGEARVARNAGAVGTAKARPILGGSGRSEDDKRESKKASGLHLGLSIARAAILANCMPVMDIQQIWDILPHRYPMLLVDRIEELEEMRVVGIKNVTINEPFFSGHFPDIPVMPGVMIIEAMAQVAGILVLSSIPERKTKLVLLAAINEAKFRRPVVPGDQLRIEMKVIRRKATIAKMNGVATVNGVVVAEAEMMCKLADRP